MTEANDFLLGGGGTSFSWKDKPIGTTIEGTVTRVPEVRQQTDMKTGELETWDNGDPKMQLVVALQTTLRESDDDDGVRNVYVKGSKKPESKSMHAAVAGAVQATKAKGLEVGGTLKVTLSGKHPSSTKGFNDANEFEAVYTPAAAGFLAPETPAAQAPVDAWATPAAAPAATTGPSKPPGMDQATWDSLPDNAKAAVAALGPAF